jgi:hypothetical protein
VGTHAHGRVRLEVFSTTDSHMPETTEPSKVKTARTEIHIHDHELAKRHPQMLLAVWTRCMQFADCTVIHITPSERKQTGWMEWAMLVKRQCGSELFIAAIQRSPDQTIEFHS